MLKPHRLGGYGFPGLIFFLHLHFWLISRKVLKGKGRAALLAQYLFGRYAIKWGWMEKDLRRPNAFCSPRYYLRLSKFRQECRLEQLGEEDGDKSKIIARREEMMMENEIPS